MTIDSWTKKGEQGKDLLSVRYIEWMFDMGIYDNLYSADF